MRHTTLLRRLAATAAAALATTAAAGQAPLNVELAREYNYQERHLYSPDARFHTSVRPYLASQADTVAHPDSLTFIRGRGRAFSVIFNEHLVKLRRGDIGFNVDPLMDFGLSSEPGAEQLGWANTRGFRAQAWIGGKVALSTAFRENQAALRDFRGDQARRMRDGKTLLPGRGLAKPFNGKPRCYDFGYSEAYVSYSPSGNFNFQLGTGKNFLGDGYRSLFLSDAAFNYPYFKVTTDFWNIKYVNLWAQFQDLRGDVGSEATTYAKKWGAFQYLSYNVTKWLNISLFEAIIWRSSDSLGGYRGFDFHYANPVIFLRPVEWELGSPDNALLGAAGKITLGRLALYGQVLLDEFKLDNLLARNGWYANKWAVQAGFKAFDVAGVHRLDLQSEVNLARPFIYSHNYTGNNYAHDDEPLAHPLGSNFVEWVSFARYGRGRVHVEVEAMLARQGRDTSAANYGNDIFASYGTAARKYGNTLLQPAAASLRYLQATASYVVNPSYNLNIYVGYANRREEFQGRAESRGLVLFGLRTSLENLYHDR